MTERPRIQNIAILLALIIIYLPLLFLTNQTALDIVSVPLLVFAVWSFSLIAGEATQTFWRGDRRRSALALYGLFAIFLSVMVTRIYGLVTRNLDGTGWLDDSHIYSMALYLQFIGLYVFTRGATHPSVIASKNRYGQLIAGVIIGAIVASSRLLEPILMFCGKLFNRIF